MNLMKKIILLFIFFFFTASVYAAKKPLPGIKKNPAEYVFFLNKQPAHNQLFITIKKDVNIKLEKLYSQYFSNTVIPPIKLEFVDTKKQWNILFEKYSFSEWGAGLAIPAKNKVYLLKKGGMPRFMILLGSNIPFIFLSRVTVAPS